MHRQHKGTRWAGLAIAAGIALQAAAAAPRTAQPSASHEISATHKVSEAPTRLASIAATRSMLLIGEIHGTNEAPALAAAIASELATKHSVVVALEWPEPEQVRVDAFLQSNGDSAAVERLTNSWFWQQSSRDGRSSRAMLTLLDRMRVLKQQGKRIRVVCFDWNWQEQPSGDRDAALAQRLRIAHEQFADARMIVLTGNYHARIGRGAPWNAEQVFAGYHLRDLEPYNVDVGALGGQAWVCYSETDCGARVMGAASADERSELRMNAAPDAKGYWATLTLPHFTASEPVVPAPVADTATPPPAQ